MKRSNIAHFRKWDSQEQSVQEHLEDVADICGRLTTKLKLGNSDIGNLLGLLHDLGKYSNQFQTYIQSATGLLNPDIDMDFVDATAMKGKIDHSTAGAQWIWQQFARYGLQGELVGQILATCLASHHGGMLDCLKPDGEDSFQSRINKADSKTHLIECLELADTEVLVKLEDLAAKDFLFDFCKILKEIVNSQNNDSELQTSFKLGFFSRFLFSCLIDAEVDDESLFHLSTSLCPAHRQIVLAKVRSRLDEGLPVLCISTQLIEAGVDVDFNSVIRFLAGLDSIAQAAGRCNRNGNFPTSQVFVVNPKEESIDTLKDIKIGREKSLRIFSEYEDGELLNPEVMTQYFSYYFYERADLMTYPLTAKQAGREDTLLNLLSNNVRNVGRDRRNIARLQQSFKTAGNPDKRYETIGMGRWKFSCHLYFSP